MAAANPTNIPLPSRPRFDLRRLTSTPVGGRVFGEDVCLDLYARNAFRFLSMSASAGTAETITACQRLRNVARLDAAAGLSTAIRTACDKYSETASLSAIVARLENPRLRLRDELFWPHVESSVFRLVRDDGQLASPALLRMLEDGLGGAGRLDGLGRHALAVAAHDAALEIELSHPAAEDAGSNGMWRRALQLWSQVLADDSFWEYLVRRAEAFDDPRVTPDDVDAARTRLPGILLGFHVLFGTAYDRHGNGRAAQRHFDLIAESAFAAPQTKAALTAFADGVVAIRLRPLVHRLETELTTQEGKLSRAQVSKVCEPVLERALRLRAQFAKRFKVPAWLSEIPEFDSFAEKVLESVGKIDFGTDDRLRCLLYSALTAKRLQALPVTSAERLKLNQSVRTDTGFIYSRLASSLELPDVTNCWFIDGEPSDPDAALLLPMYKITDRSSAEVSWDKKRVLIPRSRNAQRIHSGEKVQGAIPQGQMSDEQRRLLGQSESIAEETEEEIERASVNYEEAIAEAKASGEDRLRTLEGQTHSEASAALARLDEARRHRDSTIANEEHQLASDIGAIEERRNTALAGPRERVRSLAARADAVRGRVLAELPLSILLSIIAAMVLRSPVAIPIMLVVATACVLVGPVTRVRYALASRQAANISHRFDEEIRDRRERFNSCKADVEAEYAHASDPYKAALERIARCKAEVLDEVDKEIAFLTANLEAETARLRAQAEARMSPLRASLVRPVSARTLSTYQSFPVYSKTKGLGYKDGSRPSDDEMMSGN